MKVPKAHSELSGASREQAQASVRCSGECHRMRVTVVLTGVLIPVSAVLMAWNEEVCTKHVLCCVLAFCLSPRPEETLRSEKG